ncbi:MAG TPA: 50S ribosomal protein L10 [Phycisphaerales bacterium]|nr:50S ribosomal protein L10 [Phycisphaerales bacterium]
MSKTVKNMIIREYKARFDGTKDATLISISGVKAIDTTKLRGTLRKKKVSITVIRNSLAKKALEGSGLDPLFPLMEGNSALVYGGGSVVEIARELTKALGDFPNLELKGAVLDGTLFTGEKGVKELSKYPTREEALGKTVALLFGPGKTLAGQVKGPGATVAGLVKAIEAKLEKGETIARKS